MARVASTRRPGRTTVVIHLSGSLGLDVLGGPPPPGLAPSAGAPAQPGHRSRAPAVGDHLRGGRRSDDRRVAEALGGRAVEVEDRSRTAYHAAASIAANHMVALIGQVERVAASVGLPLDAFADLHPRRHRRRPRARARAGPSPDRRPGGTGTRWSGTDRPWPGWPDTAPSWPPTTPWSAWPGGSRSIPAASRPRVGRAAGPRRTGRSESGGTGLAAARGAGGMSTVVEAPAGPTRPTLVRPRGRRDRRRVLRGPGRGPAVGTNGGRGPHHGGAARRSPLAHRAGRRRVRRGGGLHLRQPDPVR